LKKIVSSILHNNSRRKCALLENFLLCNGLKETEHFTSVIDWFIKIVDLSNGCELIIFNWKSLNPSKSHVKFTNAAWIYPPTESWLVTLDHACHEVTIEVNHLHCTIRTRNYLKRTAWSVKVWRYLASWQS